MPISQLLKKITGQPVQPNKAIIGRNAFAHESGIHQHGLLANPETYEIMKPETVGIAQSEIVLGKHSGRAALGARLAELGYKFDDARLAEVFTDFKTLADKKKLIEDADLDALMLGETAAQLYHLVSVDIRCGTLSTPTATITLRLPDGSEVSASADGTGPVDAVYTAIEQLLGGSRGKLVEFRMDAVTAGLDAQAVVSLVLQTPSGAKFHGRAGNTDIVIAAIEAYLTALGKCDSGDVRAKMLNDGA